MPFNLGASKIGSIYAGSTKIAQAYLGSTLVYTSSGPTPPTPQQVYEFVYPIGSYYLSMDASFDPNVSFVGTWVQDTPGRITMNSSTAADLGNIGGEKSHALTVSEVPSHTHSASGVTLQTSKNGSFGNTTCTSYWNMTRGNNMQYERIYDATLTPGNAGSGTAHNNLQPYIVCVRWHRTA